MIDKKYNQTMIACFYPCRYWSRLSVIGWPESKLLSLISSQNSRAHFFCPGYGAWCSQGEERGEGYEYRD